MNDQVHFFGGEYEIIDTPDCETNAHGYIDFKQSKIFINPNSYFSKREILIHELIHHSEKTWGFKIKEEQVEKIAMDIEYAMTYNKEWFK